LSNSKSSKNALTYGLYSDNVVLDCENKQEFVELWQAFRGEYCPQQVSEEAAVLELASLHWKKRRLEAGLQQALNKRRAYSRNSADASGDSWDLLANDIRTLARSHSKAATVACDKIGEHVARVCDPDVAIAGSTAVEFEKLTVLAKELNIISKELVIPILHAAEKQKDDQIERAYDPDIVEKDLKLHADIDRRIEKVLKRLVMTKEYKKYYVAKGVDSKPREIEVLPAKPTGVSEETGPEG
jgi:hypothetical protein